MVGQQTINEYLTVLSSKQPVPGGGGASALAGAFCNGLAQMVVNLTLGKKKYQDVEEEMEHLLRRLQEIQKEFLRLSDEDARVFAPLAAAYSLPGATDEERAYKDRVMEENLLAASLVPLEIMEKTMELFAILAILGEKGSRLAVSDVGVAVQFGRAALTGAVMNVYINTKSMKNREKAGELNGRGDQMVEDGCRQADEIYETVRKGLR